jgi:hypothetical protein
MRELKKNWCDLFQLFRVALHLPKLLFSAVGLLLSIVSVGALTYVFGLNINAYENVWQRIHPLTDSVYSLFLYAFQIPVVASAKLIRDGTTLNVLLWGTLSVLILLVIWTFIGTAISRIAAVEITRDERIEGREALSFAWDRLGSSIMSFVLPVIGFAFFGIVISLVSLLINVPVLNILVMLFLPLALIGGFVMALIAVGTVGGFSLFVPSIAVEGTDSFDAISRGFSYVLSRVWHFVWYKLVSTAYGAICTGFVFVFALLILLFTNGAGYVATEFVSFPFQDVIDVNLSGAYWSTQVTGVIYYAWVLFFQFTVTGFIVSFHFSAATLIYLLMRKKVDGIDMEEVYEELDEDEDLLFDEDSFDEEFEDSKEDDGEEEDSGADSDESSEEEPTEESGADEEQEEDEQEEYECTEPDCDRTFGTEFGRDQHHRLVHQDDDDEDDE